MKYIRTKDGKIGKFYQDQSFTITCSLGCIDKDNILDRADTIDKLCDEFVFNFHDFEYKTSPSQQYELYETFRTALKEYIDLQTHLKNESKTKNDYILNLYGAIWTDKGLIYVAKMNEKGKLELL